jgi:PhnB protein
MAFTPYIHFGGRCEEAMTFYAGVFGATDLQIMRYDEAPEDMPVPRSNRVMHAQFTADGSALMASDFPEGPGDPQAGMSVTCTAKTVEDAQSRFDALSEGGAIIMPFGPTFWSRGFGMFKDRFGTHWIIDTEAAGD